MAMEVAAMEGPAARCFCGERLFGDRRLDERLGKTFNQMARHPSGTLPRKLVKRSDLVGGYRMLNTARVTHAAIIGAHRVSCLGRLAGYEGKVLVIHDTTVLDYSGLGVEGLGQVGDGRGKGLYAHNSLAVVPATREVVGLMNQVPHQRAMVPRGEPRVARQARDNRESRLWKRGVSGLPPMPPGARVTDVSNRGSDVTEFIAWEIAQGREFIVRSQHNRNLAGDAGGAASQKLHDRLRSLEAMGQYTPRVPAEGGGWREAEMGLAWERVSLPPPRQPRGEHGREPVTVWGVIAREAEPPAGCDPLEWVLLTNRPVDCAEQAREAAEDYACRWMVEDYHKASGPGDRPRAAMKSGCGIEELQMTTPHGLGNVIALLSVLAVHVPRLRCNARDERTCEQPARLHEDPLKVQLAARDAKHPDWREMTVWEFYVAVARMGGYVLNPHKRPPGWVVLWRGYVRLEDMCEGVRLMAERCVQT